jgi:hypothetical protein
MTNRNPIAIVAIGLFLMTGVVVVIAIAATIFLLLYQFAAFALRSLFGIELPQIY